MTQSKTLEEKVIKILNLHDGFIKSEIHRKITTKAIMEIVEKEKKETYREIADKIEMWADDGLLTTTDDIVKRIHAQTPYVKLEPKSLWQNPYR